jgi:hypothetical protein
VDSDSDQRDVPSPIIPEIIVQRDDGMFELGFGDCPAGPFETRSFASDVAAQRADAARPP